MKIKNMRSLIRKCSSIFLLISVPLLMSPISSLFPAVSTSGLATATPPASFVLHGQVKDGTGNPVQTNIYVTDMQNNPLANLVTDADGTYSVTIPGSRAW